jgi:DNA polymerase-4
VLSAVRWLLAAAAPMIRQQGLTLVGVSVGNLEDDRGLQLPLPLDPRDDGALDAAVDEIRRRYGRAAITRAVLLGRDSGLLVPLLPD